MELTKLGLMGGDWGELWQNWNCGIWVQHGFDGTSLTQLGNHLEFLDDWPLVIILLNDFLYICKDVLPLKCVSIVLLKFAGNVVKVLRASGSAWCFLSPSPKPVWKIFTMSEVLPHWCAKLGPCCSEFWHWLCRNRAREIVPNFLVCLRKILVDLFWTGWPILLTFSTNSSNFVEFLIPTCPTLFTFLACLAILLTFFGLVSPVTCIEIPFCARNSMAVVCQVQHKPY